jgi:uncharacterized protein YktB (UPF0637 family)
MEGTGMSGKPKLEEEYNNDKQTIEQKAKEELKKIQERIKRVKKEAAKIGATLEPQDKE